MNAGSRRRTKLFAPALIGSLCLAFLAGGTAWGAEWIAHGFDSVGYGSWLSATGADAVVVAHSSGDEIVFFSAITSEWTLHEDGPDMSPFAVLSEGSLALVVDENHALAFDARTGEVAELILQGTLLATSGNACSYRCGAELALLVTDQAMHVYDADIGAWQTAVVDVGTPSLSFSRHQAHDDYAVSFLPQPTGDPINLVYSRPQHAFNQTAQGIHAPIPDMDHGYAGYRNRPEGEDNLLVGYCAASNVFDHVLVPETVSIETTWDSGAAVDRVTTYALSWEIQVGDDYAHHIRAFDTRHDCWLEETLIFADSSQGTEQGWRRSGEICCREARTGGYYVYDGPEHTLTYVDLGLSTDALWNGMVGGRVLVAHEGSTAVGYCPPCAINMRPDLQYATFHRSSAGQDFVNFSHRDDAGDMLSLYWYHAPDNRWTAATTGYVNSEGDNTAHVHTLVSGEPQREAVFYSSHIDTLRQIDLTGWPTMSHGAGDHLGYAYNNTEEIGVLFDAHRGTCHVQNWPLFPRGRICLATEEAAGLVHGYSVNTGAWSSLEVAAPCQVGSWPRDLVGLFRQNYTNVFHAFDGSDGTWVTLETAGYYQSQNTGERTACVVTSWNAYALGTGIMAATEPDPQQPDVPSAVARSALTAVYPNPCNPRTDIVFELADRQPVRLCLHDLRGRRVRMLQDGVLPRGSHRCAWDGHDDAGRAVASGVYLVRLTTEDRIDSRKLLLAR